MNATGRFCPTSLWRWVSAFDGQHALPKAIDGAFRLPRTGIDAHPDKSEIYFGQRKHRNIRPGSFPKSLKTLWMKIVSPRRRAGEKGCIMPPFWRRQQAIPRKSIMLREAGAFSSNGEHGVIPMKPANLN